MPVVSSRVSSGNTAVRRRATLRAAALVAVLLLATVVPVCSLASACTMSCCPDSAESPAGIPAAACVGSSGCAMAPSSTAMVPLGTAGAAEGETPAVASVANHFDCALVLRDTQTAIHPVSTRLYIINDAFLI